MSKFYVWIPDVDEESNLLSSSDDFNIDDQRLYGFQSGKVISSKVNNTAIRQANLVAVALMEALAVSDGIDFRSSVSAVTSEIRTKLLQNHNLTPGEGLGSVMSIPNISPGYGHTVTTSTSGFQAMSVGGKRYDDPNAADSVNAGNQSFMCGGSLKIFGDFAGNFGKQNTVYANAGFAAGGGNAVGLDTDVNGSQGAYALGMGGHSNGQGSGTLGVNNISTSYGSIAGGSSNEVHGNGAIAFGTRHVIYPGASAAFVGGEFNFVAENCMRACGIGYYLRLNATDAIGIGTQNTVNGQRGIAIGCKSISNFMDAYAFGVECTANNRYSFAGGNGSTTNNGGAFLWGYKLRSSKSYQTIFGIRNKLSDARFIIAAGNEDDNNPVEKNVFAVYDDGRAKVYGAPTETEDAVRKKELDELKTTIAALTARVAALEA